MIKELRGQLHKSGYRFRSVCAFVLLCGLMVCMTGCEKKTYATVRVNAECGQLHDENLAKLQDDMYWGYINRRFILIRDAEGVMQYVKVNNDLERHSLDLSAFKENKRGYRVYAPEGKRHCKVGIDVSKHNGEINWQKVKKAGIDFAIIRLGYRGYGTGRIVLDEWYEWNMSGSMVAGIPRGVYFYSQAISYEEGVEEAKFVLQHLDGQELQYPIVLDTEDAESEEARTNDLTVEERTQACLGFCDTIEAAGYDVMVYSNKRWFALNLDVGKLGDYEWWYAQYNEIPTFPYKFRIWQYTADGRVDGINGKVDMNIEFLDK